MGLIKATELPSGFTVNYWRVALAQINYDAREVYFTLAGYKDKATRESTNAPITTRDISLRKDEFDQFFDSAASSGKDFRAQCYEAARFKDQSFEGATTD